MWQPCELLYTCYLLTSVRPSAVVTLSTTPSPPASWWGGGWLLGLQGPHPAPSNKLTNDVDFLHLCGTGHHSEGQMCVLHEYLLRRPNTSTD